MVLGIRVATGSQPGAMIPINGPVVIGREAPPPGNLSGDATLSRQHARIRPESDETAIVEDLGSSAGTLLNGRRIDAPTRVRAGDRLEFGMVTATVEAAAAAQRPVPYGGGPDDAHATQRISTLPQHDAFRAPQSTPAAPYGSAPAGAAAAGPAPYGSAPVGAATYGSAPAGAPPGGGAPPAWQSTPSSSSGGGRGRTRALVGIGTVVLLAAAGVGGWFIGHHNKASASSTTASLTSDSGTPAFVCKPADAGTPGAGHFRFNTSACENGTTDVTEFRLPIHKGISGGHTVWYVIMDTSDRATSTKLGVNYVPKLANAKGTKAVQKVTVAGDGTVTIPGTVDFNHKRVLVPSATGFPPKKAAPPSVGDANYSPLIQLPNGVVENAPQIANPSGQADKVIKLDTSKKTVIFRAQHGFYEDKAVHYASFDASDPGVAAIEDVTYAPNLNAAPGLNSEDLKTSARETLIAFVNGPSTPGNPLDQGVNYALKTGGANPTPLNLLHEVPQLAKHADVGAPEYTPLWNVHLAQWTPFAVNAGDRTQFRSVNAVLTDLTVPVAGAKPLVTGPGGAKFGPVGVIVNCPLVSIDIP